MQNNHPVNDIGQCVRQAHHLVQRIQTGSAQDRSLCHVFTSLAGDATVGFLAYAIWRVRSPFFSTSLCASDYKQSGVKASRVSRT